MERLKTNGMLLADHRLWPVACRAVLGLVLLMAVGALSGCESSGFSASVEGEVVSDRFQMRDGTFIHERDCQQSSVLDSSACVSSLVMALTTFPFACTTADRGDRKAESAVLSLVVEPFEEATIPPRSYPVGPSSDAETAVVTATLVRTDEECGESAEPGYRLTAVAGEVVIDDVILDDRDPSLIIGSFDLAFPAPARDQDGGDVDEHHQITGTFQVPSCEQAGHYRLYAGRCQSATGGTEL